MGDLRIFIANQLASDVNAVGLHITLATATIHRYLAV
jgi:hypothetical protein